MQASLLPFSLLACAGISTLLGGVFLAFSDIIMSSLAKAQAPAGAETMQIINRAVFTSVFGFLLWAMLAASVLMCAIAMLGLQGSIQKLVLAGGALYVLGVGAVSGRFNVPMNVLLDGMDIRLAATSSHFAEAYVPVWTMWNHVRTLSCIAAGACYLWAGVTMLRTTP